MMVVKGSWIYGVDQGCDDVSTICTMEERKEWCKSCIE